MEKLYILKVGGNVIDEPALLQKFLKDFSEIPGYKILVHGGGKLATGLADKLGIEQTLVEGRRITDAATLDLVVMVYAGLVNKKIVAGLQALACNATGLCGADGNLVRAQKRHHPEIDFGFVGDTDAEGVNVEQLTTLLMKDQIPVICPVTHDGQGNLLNTNADTLACVIALAMKDLFQVGLYYCFEKSGVLQNPADATSCIPVLDKKTYHELKERNIISKGMIPKLDNAFQAAEAGISPLVLCHASAVSSIGTQITGTQLAVA